MSAQGGRTISAGMLGALGGLAAFGVVLLVGLAVWLLFVHPSQSAAAGSAGADVVLRVAAPQSVKSGGSITYSFTAQNLGPGKADSVELSDPLPVGTTFGSATASKGNCSGQTTLSCDLGDIGKNDSVTVTVVVKAPSSGSVSNAAQISSATDDPDGSNDVATATTSVQSSSTPADLGITGEASATTVAVGKQVSVTYVIHNKGPAKATHVSFIDTYPNEVVPAGQFEVGPPGQSVSCTLDTDFHCDLGDIAADGSVKLVIHLSSKSAGTFKTEASVSSQATDPSPADNSVPVSFTVNAPPAPQPNPAPQPQPQPTPAPQPNPTPAPTKSPSFTFFFCPGAHPTECATSDRYSFNNSTGTWVIPHEDSWTLWVVVTNGAPGAKVEAHFVDPQTRQAAFNGVYWDLSTATRLYYRWIGPFPLHLKFEIVLFYKGARVTGFDKPSVVEFD